MYRKVFLNCKNLHSLFSNGPIITDGFIPEKYYDVLEGRAVMYIAKNVIPKEDCFKIALAFQNSENKDKYNVIPTIEKIGNPLYLGGKKHIQDYFDRALIVQEYINDVYKQAGTPNYVQKIFEALKDYLIRSNILLRPIVYEDKVGIYGILRSWGSDNRQKFATPIHEDKLQVRLHEELETKLVLNSNLASTCLYYSNGNNIDDGKLTLYDVCLSQKEAKYERSGQNGEYGFSKEFVKDSDYITVVPEVGDVITFLADHLHAVGGITVGTRITASFSTAFKENDNKVCLIWS